MVSLKTADGDYVVENGFISAPQSPGLGVTPRMDVLGKAVLSYS
jgi:L-alanine-DL-glutamate epimerase-like enolase superfamily enzyme